MPGIAVFVPVPGTVRWNVDISQLPREDDGLNFLVDSIRFDTIRSHHHVAHDVDDRAECGHILGEAVTCACSRTDWLLASISRLGVFPEVVRDRDGGSGGQF